MYAKFSAFQGTVCVRNGLALEVQGTVVDCERVAGQLQKPLAVGSGSAGCLQPLSASQQLLSPVPAWAGETSFGTWHKELSQSISLREPRKDPRSQCLRATP